MKAAVPPGEAARIDALREYKILDALPEQEFDDLTLLAARVCGTPVALVTLIDADRSGYLTLSVIECRGLAKTAKTLTPC